MNSSFSVTNIIYPERKFRKEKFAALNCGAFYSTGCMDEVFQKVHVPGIGWGYCNLNTGDISIEPEPFKEVYPLQVVDKLHFRKILEP